MNKSGTTILIVLDGWGYREDTTHNAVAQAKTPNFDRLWKNYSHTLLEASGLAVGLPDGQMGNSEIGHTTIGAGTIIDTDLVRIAKAIGNGDFSKNPAFKKLFEHVKKSGVDAHDQSTLHVLGLVSDGGVHSHQEHLFAFLRAAKQAGVKKLVVHIFTDGRDTAPQSAAVFVKSLEEVLTEIGIGRIASLSGRFYAMDRDNNFDRLKRAEEVLFDDQPVGHATVMHPHTMKASVHLEAEYKIGKKDELLEPVIFLDENDDATKVQQGDGIFFFNFRSDRARMLSKKILERVATYDLCYVTMTEYEKAAGGEVLVAFAPHTIETTLAAEVSRAGQTQAHIAETEKFPHATYFLNGGREKPHEGEEHILLASRKDVPTHDLAPKMRAEGIADKAIEQIELGTNFIFINFANPDMVGHTANVSAIVEAVEETDTQLGRVIEALEKVSAENGTTGAAFITADHGNAEVNIDPITGEKHTSHTINPVPTILFSKTTAVAPIFKSSGTAVSGTLADIAPTILKLMDIKQPKAMTGKPLI